MPQDCKEKCQGKCGGCDALVPIIQSWFDDKPNVEYWCNYLQTYVDAEEVA